MRELLAKAMPALFAHEGVWEGVYRHIDADGQLINQHRMRTRCEFPATGEFAYIQHNHLIWPDGREQRLSFGGSFREGRLWWDTDRFHGHGWETLDSVLMLTLHRKDEPGVRFTEMIQISDDGESRARTWQWFRDGTPFRRTLCDERRISRDPETEL
ncbi:hypothetical protein [Blastomonas sp.]|uniref:hypothetical protein n=1 Tax=Blastomonas sp. TaxID=1909299 RepID=UPI00261DE337|nr:hypothetical protein [Blastomonas sp.]MDM7957470.1 hypothetical protein [Blastomonas sp.]